MTETPNWLETKLKREDLDFKPVNIRLNSLDEVKGHLEVKELDEIGNMQIVIQVIGNKNDLTFQFKKFYMTQEEVDAFQKYGEFFKLEHPNADFSK